MSETTPETPADPQVKQVPVRFGKTGAVGYVPEPALDFWKARGYEEATEEDLATQLDPTIGDPRPEDGAGITTVASSTSEAYDPSQHSADDVAKHLASLDTATPTGQAEYDRIVQAEKDGQNRKTALPSS